MPGHGAYIVNGIDVKSPYNSAIRFDGYSARRGG
jgi:hypothetical protein